MDFKIGKIEPVKLLESYGFYTFLTYYLTVLIIIGSLVKVVVLAVIFISPASSIVFIHAPIILQ